MAHGEVYQYRAGLRRKAIAFYSSLAVLLAILALMIWIWHPSFRSFLHWAGFIEAPASIELSSSNLVDPQKEYAATIWSIPDDQEVIGETVLMFLKFDEDPPIAGNSKRVPRIRTGRANSLLFQKNDRVVIKAVPVELCDMSGVGFVWVVDRKIE